MKKVDTLKLNVGTGWGLNEKNEYIIFLSNRGVGDKVSPYFTFIPKNEKYLSRALRANDV